MKKRLFALTLAMVMVLVNVFSISAITVSADTVIFSDDFAGGKTDYDYTLYDESVDAEVKATSSGKNDEGEYDVESLEYKGADYEGSANGGWKVDITDFVTSGMKLGLSFDHLTDYYDAKVFIEVRNSSGTAVDTFDFSDAPKTTELWKSYTSSIQPTISFTSGQKVYLCVKQESGYWFVKNIELTSIGSGSGSDDNTGNDGSTDGGEVVAGSANIIPSDADITVDDLVWEIYKNDTDTTTSTVSGAKIVKDTNNHTVTFTKYNNNFTGKADITDMFDGLGKIKKIDLSFHYANTRDGSYAGIMIIDKYGSVVHKTVKKDLGKTEGDYTETITNEIKVSNLGYVYIYASPTKNGDIKMSNLSVDVEYETGGQADIDEDWEPVIVSNFTSADSAPAFEPYDSSVKADILVKDTCPDGNGEYNVPGLEYVGYDEEGNDYQGNENGGVKLNITDKIKNGDTLSLSLRYRTEYYQFVPFIEVRSSKGVVKNTYAFDVAEKTDVWVDYKSVAMPVVNFSTGDSVYFCIKCQNGFWHFSNIVLTTSADGEDVEAVDVGEKTIMNESFSGGSSSFAWSLYDTSVSAAVTLTSYGPDGGEDGGYSTPCLQFKEESYESNDNAGIKTEITSLVKNYDTLGLSLDYRSEWYNVHPFVEVVGADGAVKGTFAFSSAEKGGENSVWMSYKSAAKPEITFETGDKVYFCVKSAGGYWHLKNIVLTRSSFTGVKWNYANLTPAIDEATGIPEGNITVDFSVKNYGYEDETETMLILCLYEGNCLKNIAVKELPLAMRADTVDSFTITSDGGDTLKAFIWNCGTLSEVTDSKVWGKK